jgi:hypothetical protein
MEHVDCLWELHRVDRAIGITVIIFRYLKDSGAAETLQGLGANMLSASLSLAQCEAHHPLDTFRELAEIIQR